MQIIYQLVDSIYDTNTQLVTYNWLYNTNGSFVNVSIQNQSFVGTEQQLQTYLGTLNGNP